jgi:hypothetical protein
MKIAFEPPGAACIRAGTVSLLLLALLAARSGAQTSPPSPLDPLTAAEIQLATTNAQSSPQVQALLGSGRQVLASVDFIALNKGPADNDDPNVAFDIGRFALVSFCRYSGNLGVSAVVDVRSGAVSQVTSLSCDDVATGASEVQAVRDLAVANASVRQMLGPDASTFQVQADPEAAAPANLVQALRIQAADSADPCFGRRCFLVLFRRANTYASGGRTVVDLTGQTVTFTPTSTMIAARRHP